jgi:hypothetical protein
VKLYVWTNVMFDVGSGLAVALAGSEDEARRLLWAQIGFSPKIDDYEPYDWTGLSSPPSEVRELDQPYAVYVSGGG